MESPPRTDSDVPPYWQALGLPGLVDAHVHVMPPRLLDKVWAYFDAAGPLLGRRWPIEYRWPQERRLQHLRDLGVRAFPTLLYAHKPQMASSLNDWARDFAREQREAGHQDVLQTGTFLPEPGVETYVARAIDEGARVFKVHVQVGGFDPRDPLLDRVWALLADAGVPAVVHTGSGPTPGAFTGPGPFGEVLARHPRLTAVIAHMGMPQHAAFLDLAERYANVHLDTTMVFVDFFDGATVQTQAGALARAAAVRAAGPGAAGHGLPQHPLRLRPPARGPDAHGPRRRLDAGSVVVQRRSPVRGVRRHGVMRTAATCTAKSPTP